MSEKKVMVSELQTFNGALSDLTLEVATLKSELESIGNTLVHLDTGVVSDEYVDTVQAIEEEFRDSFEPLVSDQQVHGIVGDGVH